MRTFSQALTIAALLTAPSLTTAIAQGQPAPGAGSGFEHPPLRYHGPDPLERQFIPSRDRLASRLETVGGGHMLQPPELPPSQFMLPQGVMPEGTMETFLPPHAMPQQEYPDPTFLTVPNQAPVLPATVLTDHKAGFFQKLRVTGTWIDRNNKFDDFGVTEVDLFATFAAPLPSPDWPLLISPTYKVRYLSGPKHVDVPSRLHEAYLDLLWLPRLGRWTAILGVAPGVNSYYEASNDDAFRITGTGLARYDWSDRTQVVLGVLFLNRDDVRLLPAGGLIWQPDGDRRYELLFPKPKLAQRIAVGPWFEDWLYLGGEFGGNSYSVQRTGGVSDKLTLRDFRTYVGLERKLGGGAGYHLEIGYVMGRVIEFQSATADVEADSTAMIRGGLTF